MKEFFFHLSYLLATFLFITGLKLMNRPNTASAGNLVGAAGMVLAILGTLVFSKSAFHNLGWILAGLAIGGALGIYLAQTVKMTAMPEMVSFFNGMGGLSAMLIASKEYLTFSPDTSLAIRGSVYADLFIGGIAFSGSMIAYGKLAGKIRKDWRFSFLPWINLLLIPGYLILTWIEMPYKLPILVVFALLYGVTFVMPIGGADMPVAISLLNAFTGLTTLLTGFLYENWAMITGGMLVGASGTLLTILMCEAMNRSLWNVLIGGLGGGVQGTAQQGEQVAKAISVSDAAIQLAYASEVMIIPGYGMAVAQAQHLVKELEALLESRGVNVSYGIHPVAGRMPGHMNVLLAEADVSYDKLLELDQANERLSRTSVALIIGANDIVNPAALNDPSSSIYGMPIIEAHKAETVIIIKRSLGVGYAGIDNPLFYYPNAYMLFGNARDKLKELIEEIKNL